MTALISPKVLSQPSCTEAIKVCSSAVMYSSSGWITDSNFHMIHPKLLAPDWKGIPLAGLHYGVTEDGAQIYTAANRPIGDPKTLEHLLANRRLQIKSMQHHNCVTRTEMCR